MPINFSNIPQTHQGQLLVDPIELFRELRITDTEIKDMWLGQGDALREWHKLRAIEDIAIVLNTGAGKTLVSLLAAQSLVNETRGQVLYACATIQLVEQTATKAAGYGLNVTTYYGGKFSNDSFRQGAAPCITTYQAIFNGKSRFAREDLAAIIFDDAHAAEHIIRDHFTLTISKENLQATFEAIRELYRPFFGRIGSEQSYADTFVREEDNRDWLVPPFAVQETIGSLQEILRKSKLNENKATLFAWEHLKDRIDLCAVLINGNQVSIAPAFIPINTMPFFQKGIRRIYVSATIADSDTFIRSFGRRAKVIAPDSPAGKCERLVIVPGRQPDCKDDVAAAKQAIVKQKALILAPSFRQAQPWSDIAKTLTGDQVVAALEEFKKSTKCEKVVLVGRYDGVDLPGDTCRVMVIHDLPSALNSLERFLWERLNIGLTLKSTITSRIVQSFGRISRGMSDHGVVILTGKRLTDWLLGPKNLDAIPSFLRAQITVGKELASNSSLNDLIESVDQCLGRDPGWLAYYESRMRSVLASAPAQPDKDAMETAEREVSYSSALWDRDYAQAASALDKGIDKTFQFSKPTGAWHALWAGFAYEKMGDTARARDLYSTAHKVAKNIPPAEPLITVGPTTPVNYQSSEIARYLLIGTGVSKSIPSKYDLDLKLLDGSGEPKPTEEAIRTLGEYLGFYATRPDNEVGTGPDVLWTIPGEVAFGMELKTGKVSGPMYGKKDLYQWPDHKQWINDNFNCADIRLSFVGPHLPASPKSNPSQDMQVIELKEFLEISQRLRLALKEITAAALPLTLRSVVDESLAKHGLLWPDIFNDLPKFLLKEG